MDVEEETRRLVKRAKKIQIADQDTGDFNELITEFQIFRVSDSVQLQSIESISKKSSGKKPPFILVTDISVDEEKVICGLSNDQIKAVNPNRMTDSLPTFQTLTHRHNGLSCLRCSKVNSSIFYTSSSKEGTVFQWDQRQESLKPVQKFNLSKESGISSGTKPILSLDINQNDQLLSAGTELVDEDSFLLFWDVRSSKLLGAYSESHSDDITAVKFNQDKGNFLSSGSTDGLLNIFNLLESTEDDALQFSFNTESSVDSIEWGTFAQNSPLSLNPDGTKKSLVTCVTHTNELHVFDVDLGDQIRKFDRQKVAQAMKRSNPEAVYLNSCFRLNQEGTLGLFTCSLAGSCARSLHINEKELKPGCLFNDQLSVIQSVQRFSKTNRYITFDEDGYGKIWEPDSTVIEERKSSKSLGKGAGHQKKKRFQPYDKEGHT